LLSVQVRLYLLALNASTIFFVSGPEWCKATSTDGF
jgi:hypothetical protein